METLKLQFYSMIIKHLQRILFHCLADQNLSNVMLFCGQIEFEDESWLSVRREDVYKANEDLPLKVQQRLVSKE